jgi:hypothetical protein
LMRLVWNSFLSPPSSDRAKEPFQPLFFCFNQTAYGTAVTGNVEPLKRGEIDERSKIAELFAPGKV